jgi:hypothetical protein
MKPCKSRGKRDEGWNCRDHAAMLGWLLQLGGIQSRACTGKMIMVCGPTAGGPPCGLELDPHTWNFVENFGYIDISVRVPRFLFPDWESWKVTSVVGSTVQSEFATDFRLAVSAFEYEDRMAAATHVNDGRMLLYRPIVSQPVDFFILGDPAGWINSLLTVELQEDFKFGSLIYLQLLFHLWKTLQGERETLTAVSRTKAWSFIAKIPAEEIWASFQEIPILSDYLKASLMTKHNC